MAIFAVKDLSFAYPTAEKRAIIDLSFHVQQGEFLTLAGATGSGKTTLLKLLKPALSPKGERSGKILFNGQPLDTLSPRDAASLIGYVAQDPDRQIVTDKVWHELAFGLESLGLSQSVIRRRVAEAASFFGIDAYFEQKTSELSGGQKQLLSLASVAAAQPEILLLDEPTAQLDPVAAKNFLSAVKRLNRELGVTVILTEHRLEDVVPLSDRLMILDKGKLLSLDTPEQSLAKITKDSPLFFYMPAASRLWAQTGRLGDIPLNITQGRKYVRENFDNAVSALDAPAAPPSARSAIEIKNVFFRYERASDDVLKGLDLNVREGEVFCLLGPNASGKTTALSVLAGLRKPYAGKVKIFEKDSKRYINQSLYQSCLALLPQDVTTVFLKNTVEEELKDAQAELSDLPFDLSPLLSIHPYDLSGGEQQMVALAKVLSNHPKLLLLDEPTKGLDPYAKEQLKEVIKSLQKKGMAILIVTHDVEFSAEVADRCALLFKGELVCVDTPREMFCEGQFYTTAASKITKGYYDKATTVSDIVLLCEKNGRKT